MANRSVGECDALRSLQDGRISAVEGRCTALEARVTSGELRGAQIEVLLASIGPKVDTIHDQLIELKALYQVVPSDMGAILDLLASIQGTVNEIEGALDPS